MPTIAIGSSLACGLDQLPAWRLRPPLPRSAGTWPARPRWDSRRSGSEQAAGRWPRPAGCAARPRQASRSRASLKARSGSTSCAEGWPSTAAAWVRTSSSTTPRRSASGIAARRCCERTAPLARGALATRDQPAEDRRQVPAQAWARRMAVVEHDGCQQRLGEGRGPVSKSSRPCSGGIGEKPRRARICSSHPRRLGVIERHGRSPLCLPKAPRPARWRAGRGSGGERRARRGTRWRPRSWPGRHRRGAPPRRRRGRTRESSIRSVSSCRCQAASALGRMTRSRRSASSDSSTPSSSRPAEWTTAPSGCSSGIESISFFELRAVGDVAGRDRRLGARAPRALPAALRPPPPPGRGG